MKSIALFAQHLEPDEIPYLEAFIDEATQSGFHLLFYEAFKNLLPDSAVLPKDAEFFKKLDAQLDFLVTLGGDGTILNAIKLVRDSGVPIMGINLGRLGFLANVEKKIIGEAIKYLASGSFKIEHRTLLAFKSNEQLFEDFPFALNDMTLVKRDTSSMIVVHVYLDGEFLNSYWADGIILATPTGSTGYNMSCSGPILMPSSNNFIITPIAPHNLNVRPLVLSDASKIELRIEGRTENFLCTLDSRYETVTSSTQIHMSKAPFVINMVKLPDVTFLSTMREKLMWGRDTRNFK